MNELDSSALLHQVTDAARHVMRASAAAVAIVGDKGTVDDFAAVGLDDSAARDLRRWLAPNGDHPARAVFEARAAVHGVNPGGDPTAIRLPASHPPVHSYLFVPVASPSRVYGCLGLVETIETRAFSEQDVEVAAALGALTGVAYENARRAAHLQAYEEHTDFALSAAHTAVLYYDFDSPSVEVSRSTAELFGLPLDAGRVAPEELLKSVHPDDAPLVRAAVDKAIEDCSDFEVEFRRAVGDEEVRWFHFRGRVLSNEQGQPWRFVALVTDVTDRFQLGLQLRQWEKMDALSQLAHGLAYDLNNLLTPIVGYGRFALESVGDPLQRHDLEEIVKAADRAAALTKRLLAFSRRHTVSATVLDLNLLIDDMITTLRAAVGTGVDLGTSLTAAPPYVRADRRQLEQVIMTLVVNAGEAVPISGGHIRVATKAVDLDEWTAARIPGLNPGPYVALSVIDNGSGMTEVTKARLFEPFFTTKPRARAAGLGLATVYGIVTQSGGGVQVESEWGQGSTFTVYLPREHAPSPAPHAEVQSPSAPNMPTVLLVEDDHAVRELIRTFLERANYRVVEAATAVDAITLGDRMASVDLLISEIAMPGTSGFELSKKLVERRPSLRVLFMSAYADSRELKAIAEQGAGLLEKPFSAQALVSRVREMLSGKEGLSGGGLRDRRHT
jgi:signal transduction histidine kinase/CheY-like chemotaxis protein